MAAGVRPWQFTCTYCGFNTIALRYGNSDVAGCPGDCCPLSAVNAYVCSLTLDPKDDLMWCSQDDNSCPLVVRETVAAVLDGATPLHCSALRGNPAQVDHLLYCGAVPTCKTAAGELPIELVPVCGSRAMPAAASNAGVAAAGTITAAGSQPEAVQRSCRCMGPHDQDVWECRSRLARSLIARSCFFSFGVGLFSWLRLVAFCLLCLLGQAGCYTSILRCVVLQASLGSKVAL